MNDKDFREALSEIGNDPDALNSSNAIINRKNRIKRAVTISVTAVIVLAIAVTTTVVLSTKVLRNNNEYNGIDTVQEKPSRVDETKAHIDETMAPEDESQTHVDETRASENETQAHEDETQAREDETPIPHSDEPFWFKGESLTVKRLGYGGGGIVSFEEGCVGAKLISTTVFGEHESCGKVYYNTETQEIYCVYHEFLKASGISAPRNHYIYYMQDMVRDDLICIQIIEKNSLDMTDLWLFDMGNRSATRVGLPDGSSSYRDIDVYPQGLCNGKLALCVNDNSGNSFVSMFNSDTGEYQYFGKDAGLKSLTCAFLTETVLELSTPDGYYAWNMVNSRMFELLGEHNIVFDGLLYSVKNWLGGSYKNAEVAVYDVETGIQSKGNGRVLVLAALDNGSYGVITVDDETGEKTVIMDHITRSATAWSRDYGYFYAYSDRDNRVLCYSVSTGQWTFEDVPPVDEDPVLIEGDTYAVFNSYRLAVDDSCKEVLLYYTRTLEQIPDLPDFEDQKVDSPYWDVYRDIAANNYFTKTDFWSVTYKEDRIPGEGWYGHDVANMEILRDSILLCLETRGETVDFNQVEIDDDCFKMLFRCGTFHMDFYEKDGRYYLRLCANRQHPLHFADEFSEIPEETFLEIMDMHISHVLFSWLYPTARIDDVSDPKCKVVLDESEKSYLHNLISSGNWKNNDFQAFTFFRPSCGFIDGDMIYSYEPNLKVLLNPQNSTYTELSPEECAAIEAMLK